MSAFGPRCPNHGVVLNRSGERGIGICPISDARFTYDEDQAEKTKRLKLDAMGNQYYDGDWKVTHLDGKDN